MFKAIVKQMKYQYEKYLFSILLLMLYYKKCVFKASEKLFFSLFSYFCNMKKTEGYFLVYASTFLIRKTCFQNKRGLFFSSLSYSYNTKMCV